MVRGPPALAVGAANGLTIINIAKVTTSAMIVFISFIVLPHLGNGGQGYKNIVAFWPIRKETDEDRLDPKDIAKCHRKRGRSVREITDIVQKSTTTVQE
jgi:hypothetical protein